MVVVVSCFPHCYSAFSSEFVTSAIHIDQSDVHSFDELFASPVQDCFNVIAADCHVGAGRGFNESTPLPRSAAAEILSNTPAVTAVPAVPVTLGSHMVQREMSLCDAVEDIKSAKKRKYRKCN